MSRWISRGLVVSAMVAAPCLAALPAQAAASTIYVAPNGTAAHHNRSCADAKYKSIQAATNAVAWHGTVVVCAGTYHETVTITKSLKLAGRTGAVVNAKGFPYGIGMTASYVTVTGLTVENAGAGPDSPNDGIITAGFGPKGPVPGNHETIMGNNLKNNLGAGIDLNSTSWSVAKNNVANNNGIGINSSDDLGKPASHNSIFSNIANNNAGGCGIVLADHTGVGISPTGSTATPRTTTAWARRQLPTPRREAASSSPAAQVASTTTSSRTTSSPGTGTAGSPCTLTRRG